MKRLVVVSLSLAVCACAGLASAFVAGAAPVHAVATTAPAPAPEVIPQGVTIMGVDVGGLAPEIATELVLEAYDRPLLITYVGHRFVLRPSAVSVPAIQRAIERALDAQPFAAVPLQVTVRRDKIRAYLADIDKRLARKPVDAALWLRKLRPWISKERAGRVLDRSAAEAAVVNALITHSRGPLKLRAKAIAPSVRRADYGDIIVIRRGSHRLSLYDGMRFVRQFPVATGTTKYPTPLGRFRIVVKWKNPWWYPPDSDWAKDREPIPPGPSNPLGTRWMGISSPGVGIHGTPEPGSIGYSVSHGCIRMRIPDAEWLFERVPIGTPVFIVAA